MSTDIILMIIGVVLVLVSIYSSDATKRLSKKGISTEAIVYDFEEREGYPVFRFTTTSGEWITQECKKGFVNNSYNRGEKVIVVYDPDKPTDFAIKSSGNSLMSIVMIIAGIGLLGAGVLMVFEII